MPSPIESSSETPQIRYPWESKQEEPRQLQMAEEYEDLAEPQKSAENQSTGSDFTMKFNKEVPVAEKEVPAMEEKEEAVAMKFEPAPAPIEEKEEEKVFLLEEEKEETKMIDAGEDQPEEIVPLKINVGSDEPSAPEKPTGTLEIKIGEEPKIEESAVAETEVTPPKIVTPAETTPEENANPAVNEKSVTETPETIPSNEETPQEEKSAEVVETIAEEPKMDAQTKERIEFLGKEIADRWEEYKNEPNREKVSLIDFEEMTEKTAEEKDALLEEFQTAFRSLLFRIMIEEEKEKLGLEISKTETQKPNDNPSNKEFINNQLDNLHFDPTNRDNFKQYVFDIVENLRFKNFEEKYDLENAKAYSAETDKMKNISRDELGQLLLDMAKESIDNSGSIPETAELEKIYEEKFGAYLKNCDLFDIEIILKENAIIAQMAKEKGIQNIEFLTAAFERFLNAKKIEKERKVREYLSKRLKPEEKSVEAAEITGTENPPEETQSTIQQ